MPDLDVLARVSTDAVGDSAPALPELIERAETRHRRRVEVRGVGVAAMAIVMLFGALLVVRPSSSTLDTANGAVDESGNVIAPFNPLTQVPEPWNAVIFFVADATAKEIGSVQALMNSSDIISDSVFVTKQETYDEFLEYFADDPDLLTTVTVETMPPSIRLSTDDLASPLFARIDERSEVRTIMANSGRIPKPILVYGSPVFDRRATAQLRILSRAGFDVGFRRCMAANGFESQEPPTTDGVYATAYLDSVQQDDALSYAEAWGFGLHQSIDGEPRNEPPSVQLDEDDPYYKAAFGGFFGRGCEGDAADDWLSGQRSVNDAWEEIYAAQLAFAADQRVIDHYQEWSDCMGNRGFDTTSPLDAYNQLQNTPDQQGLELEMALAPATVECGESTSELISLQLANVWIDHADGDWDSHEVHVSSEECLGDAALEVDLDVLRDPVQAAELFPDSCFE